MSAGPSSFIALSGICKRFGATRALQGVDFAVRSGEIHALIGENGAGKSTLMKIISGALHPDAGGMKLRDRQYRPVNPQQARQAGIGMIYQELSLAPHLTVQENIALGSEPQQRGIIRWRKMREMACQALEKLGHAEISPEKQVSHLTVAEQQLVEIARALAIGCQVLVLDEPTSSLGYQDIEKLFSILRHLRTQGHAIIYISHFLEEVKALSDRFTVLRDGRVVGNGDTATVQIDEIVRMMAGRSIKQLYTRSPHQMGEPVLEVTDLAGPGKPKNATFTLHRGEVLGIAGLVGAGRSELLRILFGLHPVKKGQIKIGVFTGFYSPARRWYQGLGFLSEDRGGEGLALNMSIADNLTLSALHRLSSYGLLLPSHQNQSSRIWIDQLDIKCFSPQQKAIELSGGNQQKLALARLLYHDVDILLLDEPTRGIDVSSKVQIYELIDRLARGMSTGGKRPKAILMVSSYLPELLGVCDRIAVMHRGRLGAARPVTEWNEHKLMIETINPMESA